jgi:hypothetical protein
MTQTVSKEQAVSVLIQAVKIGQAKGAYSLEDAALIAQAIGTLVPKQAEAEQNDEVAAVTESDKES